MEVRLVCDVEQIERDLLAELARILEQGMARAVPGITRSLAPVIEQAILRSPEYESLVSDQLWHELGVVDGAGATRAIIEAIVRGMQVTSLGVRVQGKKLVGGLKVEFLRDDYEDLLGLPEASFRSFHRRRGTVSTVTWLEWLLKKGTEHVVFNFQYEPGPFPQSRTGFGIMVEADGDAWGVPSQFAGTSDNNWLTRALDVKKTGPEIEKVIQQELGKVL